MVDKVYLNFTSVVAIYGTWSIEACNTVSICQAGTGTDLNFISIRNLSAKTCRNKTPLSPWNYNRALRQEGPDIHSGCPLAFIAREHYFRLSLLESDNHSASLFSFFSGLPSLLKSLLGPRLSLSRLSLE